LQFNQARDLIKKLIEHKLLFHLVLINNCDVKIFSKRSSVINSIYSGQQQFSYNWLGRGILTGGEGSVQLTSSLR
jgi:hypothetical protein